MPVWEEKTYVNLTEGGFFKAFEYANSITDNLFGVGILSGFYMIVFISMSKYGTDRAFATASFLSFVLSVIMRAGSLIGDVFVVILAIMTMISMIVLNRK